MNPNITRIEDMSETERRAWITLLVDGAVFAYFWSHMTSGWGQNFRIIETSASALLEIYIGLIIITIILHAVIASVFAARKRRDDVHEKDERDVDIERRGQAYGYGFLAIAINSIIFVLLVEYSLEGYEPVTPMSLLTPAHMFFALMSAAFIGDLIKNGVMVWAYRGP